MSQGNGALESSPSDEVNWTCRQAWDLNGNSFLILSCPVLESTEYRRAAVVLTIEASGWNE